MNKLEHVVNKILETEQGRIDCVRLSLFCAEDVFYLCNKKTKPVAQTGIELVKKWLEDNKSVKSEELHRAIWECQDKEKHIELHVVTSMLRSAFYETLTTISIVVIAAASVASLCAPNRRHKKHQYILLAKNFLCEFASDSIVGKGGIKDEVDLAVFLDEETNFTINENDKVYLKLRGIKVWGKNNQELAKNIFKVESIKNYVLGFLNDRFN